MEFKKTNRRREYRYIAMFFLVVLFSCNQGVSQRRNISQFKSEVSFTAFYSKDPHKSVNIWSKVNRIKPINITYNDTADHGKPMIIIDRLPQVDTFRLVETTYLKNAASPKTYKGFKFLGTFEPKDTPFDYYMDFYLQENGSDVLQILKNQQGSRLSTESMAILYAKDSINYLLHNKTFATW